ncbi:MAG TPA: rRNA maturation RNase YbeY [Verrucomicrobiae bacterium]|nr:rRNA maturation RNase YbeY [Verrucomicrobiae bacterium]
MALINRQRRYRLPLRRLRPQLERLARLRPLAHPEVSVVFLGSRAMAAANGRFLGHAGPTDVITFEHGEILVCADVAHGEARGRGIPFAEEVLRYAVHGWLHLCGYDDGLPADRRRMHAAQERLVACLTARV